jgi:phospholipase D1/2
LLIIFILQGVLIYIIIWNEPIVGFEMQSQFVVDYMNDLHPNFRAIGHPNTVAPMWWTHHQKFGSAGMQLSIIRHHSPSLTSNVCLVVVVDEVIAFVGGIDLAYGRYDDDEYSILDPMDLKFPGRDYCNFYHMAESNGPTKVATIDRRRVARLPWQDVHMQVKGAPAKGT